VVESAITDAAKQLISERGLRIALQPNFDVTPYVAGQDLAFGLSLELLPDIEPTDFAALQIERPVAEVDESAIDTMLNGLAEFSRAAEPVTEDRGAVDGDVVVIDFDGTVDGVAKDGMKAEGHELTLGQHQFLPEFEAGLLGAKAGEHRQVVVTFPEGYHAADLVGQQAVFEIDVKELRERLPVAVDDALAKRFGLDDLAALRESARARLVHEYGELSRRRVKRVLMDKLAELHTFPVPPTMIDIEFDAVWSQWQHEKEAGRVSPKELARDEESLKAEYRIIAERRVRLGLLLAEVGQRNNIKVTQEEVNRAIVAEARRYPGHEREVLDLFRKNEQAVERLRTPLFEGKAIDFVLELVQITERPVSIEELRRDPEDEDDAGLAA
jgi:trigger factor